MALRNRIERAGYAGVPETPNSDGVVLSPLPGMLLPRLGIWIMPDNSASGILEDFLAFLVPQDSKLFEHVQKSIAGIREGEQRFPDSRKSKAVIHTWLAWQEEPGKPLGTAITAKFLDPGVPEVDAFVEWLKALFQFPSA